MTVCSSFVRPVEFGIPTFIQMEQAIWANMSALLAQAHHPFSIRAAQSWCSEAEHMWLYVVRVLRGKRKNTSTLLSALYDLHKLYSNRLPILAPSPSGNAHKSWTVASHSSDLKAGSCCCGPVVKSCSEHRQSVTCFFKGSGGETGRLSSSTSP